MDRLGFCMLSVLASFIMMPAVLMLKDFNEWIKVTAFVMMILPIPVGFIVAISEDA